jgi:hypothetical protein
VPDELVDAPGADRIETGRGFVEQDVTRLQCQRPRYGNPLLHAVAELRGVAVREGSICT